MVSRYGLNIVVANTFLVLLLARPDTAYPNDFEALLLAAFSIIPLYLVGNLGTNAVEGIGKITGEILTCRLSPQHLIKFQMIRVPAFIYEISKAFVHCVFASIMARTYVYCYYISALFREDEWILEASTQPVLILYIAIFMAFVFIKIFLKFETTKKVAALNAELNH